MPCFPAQRSICKGLKFVFHHRVEIIQVVHIFSAMDILVSSTQLTKYKYEYKYSWSEYECKYEYSALEYEYPWLEYKYDTYYQT